MPQLPERLTVLPLVWAMGLVLVSWPHMPGHARRALSLLASAGGIVCLVLALGSEGWRESVVTSAYLVGAPEVIGHARATASLPWYVATAVCLLLGTVGLAVSEERVETLARHWLGTTIALSLGVTLVRFALEKAAAPPLLTFAVGITWQAPVVGAFFAACVRAEGGGWRDVLGALVRYAYAARAGIAALMVVASLLRLGTHYDISGLVKVRDPFSSGVAHYTAGSLGQVFDLAVVPQLGFWPLYTIATGLLGAAVATAAASAWRRVAGVPPLDVPLRQP